ncbi:hypothetical protein [Halpernia frigidisoli]|uniref:Uncharacterized protein n=1 Tax=Halpernia frigidisoli TaxID=1125876 RepID=A0A1I3IJS8_9FLAO|nr:hypothetical protein [Halpernia frigidisoli]SFI48181.1 hypothetical protein SAMN05443292_2650 [Halpernia frigidisoli]
MEKISFLFFTLLFGLKLNAQKKEVYVDDNFSEISKKEFLRNNDKMFYSWSDNQDSITYNIRVQRIAEGKLDEVQLKKIKDFFNLQQNFNKKFTINYYQGIDDCNKNSDQNEYVFSDLKEYIKKFEKINSPLFLVYADEKGLTNRLQKFEWIYDKAKIIEEIFFNFHYPCDSAIVISPDGNFVLFRGEHKWEWVFNIAFK